VRDGPQDDEVEGAPVLASSPTPAASISGSAASSPSSDSSPSRSLTPSTTTRSLLAEPEPADGGVSSAFTVSTELAPLAAEAAETMESGVQSVFTVPLPQLLEALPLLPPDPARE